MHAHCGPCDVTMPRCAAHSPSPCPACLQPGLLPVPAQLFQGSLLLGGIAKLGLTSGKCWLARSVGLLCCAVLLLVLCVLSCCWARPTGACPRAATDPPCHPCHPLPLSPRAEALSHSQVFVSPLLVGGWCGLVTTALNCLPVGNLDGGRTMLVSEQEREGREGGVVFVLASKSKQERVGVGLPQPGCRASAPSGLRASALNNILVRCGAWGFRVG